MRRRTRSAENINLYPFDPEIERTLRANLVQSRREMEGQHDGNLPPPPPPPFHPPPPPHLQQIPQVQPGNINNLPLAPPRPSLRAIQRPTIGSSPICIRLSESARNYELKTLHFNMLPSFHSGVLYLSFGSSLALSRLSLFKVLVRKISECAAFHIP